MAFVSYYTRVTVQFVLFIFVKIIILRGRSASPRISFERGSHLVAANHRSGMDPFTLLASLRFRDFFRLAPFSFMTANAFMKPLWVRPFAWLTGCFPARPGLGPHGIDKAVDNLDSGYTVVIFPEGKRVKDTVPEAKRGVSVILDRSPDTRLILVHIEWRAPLAVDFVHIAYPSRQSIPKSPQAIMSSIYEL